MSISHYLESSRHIRYAPFVLLLCAVCLGCGGEAKDAYRVTGTVSFRGQPLPGGYVTFVSDTVAPVRCVIDEQGNYTAMVPAGSSQVAILVALPGGQDTAASATQAPDGQLQVAPETRASGPKIPAKYENHRTSGLQFDVQPSEENHFDIPLE